MDDVFRPDEMFPAHHYNGCFAECPIWEQRSALRAPTYVMIHFEIIGCDVSHHALVPHYKHISVHLAGLCLLSITRKLQRREKLVLLEATKNAMRVYSQGFDVRNVLLQSFNLTVNKKFSKEEETFRGTTDLKAKVWKLCYAYFDTCII